MLGEKRKLDVDTVTESERAEVSLFNQDHVHEQKAKFTVTHTSDTSALPPNKKHCVQNFYEHQDATMTSTSQETTSLLASGSAQFFPANSTSLTNHHPQGESQVEPMSTSPIVTSTVRKCSRCLAGEGGHINHLLA